MRPRDPISRRNFVSHGDLASPRSFVSRASIVVVLSATAACTSLLGIQAPIEIDPVECGGEACASEDAVCLFDACTTPCDADSDCDENKRCLAAAETGGCVTFGLAACGEDDDCPGDTVCSDGQCRVDCRDGQPCLGGQECSPAGACVGTDPGHDADAVCENGAIRCAGRASNEREICEDEVWVPGTPCEDSTLCDSSTAGECKEVPERCAGRDPGESFCEDTTRWTCGEDRVTLTEETCESAAHCTFGSGADCAVCLPGSFSCDGQTLLACRSDGSGFDEETTCEDEPCNAEAGACTTKACAPVGKKQCDGNVLEECNDDQSAYEEVQTCSVLCDPIGLECDVCVAETVTCTSSGTSSTDRGTFSTCDEEGQGADTTTCPADEPFCLGSGNCVECTSPSHCDADECYEATCGGNQCGQTPADAREVCQTDKLCDGAGHCVNCLSDDDCGSLELCRDDGECYDSEASIGGNPSATGQVPISAGELMLMRLPPLEYAATLARFGIVGTASGSGVKFALYAGTASTPNTTTPPIAYTTTLLGLANGAVEATPNTSASLAAGTYYWLGFVANVGTNVRSETNASQEGTIYSPYTHDLVPSSLNLASRSFTNEDDVLWSAYIEIVYDE